MPGPNSKSPSVDAITLQLQKHLSLQETTRQQAIKTNKFQKDLKALAKEIADLEQQTELEPEDKISDAEILCERSKQLIKLLDKPENFLDLGSITTLDILKTTHLPQLISLKVRTENMCHIMRKSAPITPILSDPQKTKNAFAQLIPLVQKIKVKKAYQAIREGRKYKKAGLPKDKKANPIQYYSQKNLQALKESLRNEANTDPSKKNSYESKWLAAFGLLPDEIELFKALLNLPYKLQHATNHFVDIAREGRVSSLSEIRRSSPGHPSTFTTNGNLAELGNGGFVFFRCFVEGCNSDQTRYGNTRLIADLSLLREIGWISLHDQLVPFSSRLRKESRYIGNRLIFQATPGNVKNKAQANKSCDGMTYEYRETPIKDYEKGKKDRQKDFGDNIATHKITVPFTSEIFYGPDILPGIALTLISRLRHLAACGYRQKVLKEFNSAKGPNRKIFLGNLIKDFFRIEGKYPVALPLRYQEENNAGFFTPYAGSDLQRKRVDRQIVIENPDGDGRLNFDLSFNEDNRSIAFLERIKRQLEDSISVKQKRTGDPILDAELQSLRAEKTAVGLALDTFTQRRQTHLDNINELCEEELPTWLIKRHFEFIEILSDQLLPCVSCPDVVLANLETVDLAKLKLLTHDHWLDLLEKRLLSWEQLFNLDLEALSEMPETDLDVALNERGMPFATLLRYFQKEELKFTWATTADLDELLIEYACNGELPEGFLDFYDEIGSEPDWEFIEETLEGSDWQRLQIELGHYSEVESDSDNESNASEDDDEAEYYPSYSSFGR